MLFTGHKKTQWGFLGREGGRGKHAVCLNGEGSVDDRTERERERDAFNNR